MCVCVEPVFKEIKLQEKKQDIDLKNIGLTTQNNTKFQMSTLDQIS